MTQFEEIVLMNLKEMSCLPFDAEKANKLMQEISEIHNKEVDISINLYKTFRGLNEYLLAEREKLNSVLIPLIFDLEIHDEFSGNTTFKDDIEKIKKILGKDYDDYYRENYSDAIKRGEK